MKFLILLPLLFSACTSTPYRPCSEGGQAAHETGVPFRGIKKCTQIKDKDGNYVNHGKYFEWGPNEKIQTVGEYEEGKKSGRWVEYNDQGKMISEKYFKKGQETEKP